MKKILSLLLAFSLALSLAACGGSASSAVSSTAVSEAASSAAASEEETAAPLSATEPLRIAGLKGPTTMGLVNLLSMEQAGTAAMDYDLQLYGAADEIVPLLIKGELDMAAIPANLAATLYQKTNGGIQAVAVNTLGVLYVVEQGDTVHSMADLKGRTILSTGKGTTPEYVLRYLLTANGIDPDKDVDIQYYSEATEVTAQMASTQDAIAVLPQPYVTAAGLKDDAAGAEAVDIAVIDVILFPGGIGVGVEVLICRTVVGLVPVHDAACEYRILIIRRIAVIHILFPDHIVCAGASIYQITHFSACKGRHIFHRRLGRGAVAAAAEGTGR